MADSPKRTRLLAEMSVLQKQQLESFDAAAFGGWTAVAKREHDRRADRLDLLLRQLAELAETA